jgi:cytochrome c-type biogenesis protein CcmH
MTPFVSLAIALGVLAAAWLTRPLWWPVAANAKPSAGLAAALAIFVFGIAGAGYFAIGSPGHLGAGPGVATAPSAATGTQEDAERAQALQQIASMVDQLAERLKTRPDDAEGWQMLARSYAAIGKHPQAVDAFRKAAQLRPDDPALLADFAFAVAMTNGRNFAGEPTQLVERALKIDPKNPKALALAGTVAFDRKDYPGAVQYWERLALVETGDGQFAEQIRASIAQARQLAGMPAAATPVAGGAPAAPAAAAPAAVTSPSAKVSGTVSLSQLFNGRVAPDDTVFVFARAAEGNRMPLAIVRKQVKDLPLQFTLDDSMAMSPAAKLSSASSVIVGARISKSGNAMPQGGDLQGLAPAVTVGASGIKVEINQEVAR